MLNFWWFGGFACEQTLISFQNFLRFGKSYCGNYEYVLKFHSLANLSLRVDFLQRLPFSGGGNITIRISALFVANRTFRKSKIVNCCFRILQCFHWISDEFNDIVVNFSKRVFRDCKMFLLTFKPLTSKNRRFLRFV